MFSKRMFSKKLTAEECQLTDREIIIGDKHYPLDKIKQVEARQLGVKQNLLNIMGLSLFLSAATWAFAPSFGIPVFVLSMLISCFSWTKYELRAEFKATDETGDYWQPLIRSRGKGDFKIIKQLYSELLPKVATTQ